MMEHSSTAAKTNMTVTAFLGCRWLSTRPIQPDSGNTPSRATAKRSREEATTAMLVFCNAVRYEGHSWGELRKEKDARTMMRPITAMMVMKMLGPFPKASG
jgi:hypothetical protein